MRKFAGQRVLILVGPCDEFGVTRPFNFHGEFMTGDPRQPVYDDIPPYDITVTVRNDTTDTDRTVLPDQEQIAQAP